MDDADVDRLYALPLNEFTAERNALAKRLRAEGEREAADEVKALAKPTTAAWIANQLARTNEVQVRALLRAGDRLRDAQRAALEEGDADALREAQREEREVVARLTAQARGLAPSASDAIVERVAETLRAAAVGDDETRDRLKRGRLTQELELSGFTALEGMPVAAKQPARRPKREGAAERAQRRKALAAARDRVKQAKSAARAAEREAARAEREAKALRRDAEAAQAELERAEEELERLD